jgi:hypothetical protein
MARQLRIYTMQDGRLDDWIRLYCERVRPLRERSGFAVEGFAARGTNQFVWIVERPGSEEEFEAADRAYYEQPEHQPLHEEALQYLAKGESLFLDPVCDP